MAAYSPIKIKLANMLKIFIPMLLSFLASRLLLQTDLVFLSPLGENVIAAFGVPARIMLLDTIIAFAVAPVVSVLVAQKQNTDEKRLAIEQSLSISFCLGIFLLIICSFIYPYLTLKIIPDQSVAYMAKPAVQLLTLAIPAQLITFTGTMILFSLKKGHKLLPMYAFCLILNAILDAILIHYLEVGFLGAYLSTLFVSCIRCGWVLYLLKDTYSLSGIIKCPPIECVKLFMKNVGPEFARTLSWQIFWFATLFFFAKDTMLTWRLSAYSVATEFYFLFSMFFVALMRTTAITASEHHKKSTASVYSSFKKVVLYGIFPVIVFSLILMLSSSALGTNIYHLSGESLRWWNIFITSYAISLPLCLINSIQRGIWQSKCRFGSLFTLDLFLYWVIFLPGIYLGLKINNPWLTWIGFFLTECLACIYLYTCRMEKSPNKPIRVANEF